jgi:DNA-binding beta-propeller fold protein YncE
LQTFGIPGRPSNTGATSIDFRTIQYAAGPFNYPTDLAVAPNGELYITDGYGNARVHRFTPDGQLIESWGEPGSGPEQFHIPHAIAIDRGGIIYVADRENSRLQLFTLDGQFITAWDDIARPNGVFIDEQSNVFVAELGYRAGMWPGTTAPNSNPTGGRMSIFNRNGELLARWGGGDNPCAPGDFFAPHDVWIDARGDLYVGEVTWSGGGNKGVVPRDCHCVQKFVRLK